MQLATSQRPHPPPVPPRPSRQVVAEALKRTARPPPCPTRQAPPPPNTRPWRHEDQETRVGRTVVYESAAREEEKQQQQSNGQKVRSHESQRPLASPRGCSDEPSGGGGNNITANTVPAVVEKTEARSGGGVGGATRAAPSERNEAENQRERQQQRRRSSGGDQRCDRENSAIQLGATDAESGRCASDEKAAESGRPVETCFERKKDEANCDEKKPRVFDKSTSRVCQESPKISERLDGKSLPAGLTSESIARSTEAVGRAEDDRNADDGRAGQRRSSSFGRTAADSQGEAAAAPTKIAKLPNAGVNNDKAGEARRANEEPIGRANDCAASGAAAATTISSDDCATVVVVDEPERKIAFSEDNDNIHHQDWLEAGIRYSSTKITLPGDDPVDRADEFGRLGDNRDEDGDYDNERRGYVKYDNSSICERIAMSSLQGLPPLPRSLSGFNLSEGRREAAEPPPPPARSSSKSQKNVKSTQPSSSRPSPPGRQLTTLDTQLAILRKEMFGLRQLDLSLLSQLWSLNESIQEFRQLLQEQEDRAPSPSPSSEEGDDNSYGSHPPPPPRRPAPLLHHHRPPRPPRPLRPPASDDSPSSEEYGAV